MQWLVVVTLMFSFPACAGAEQEAEPSPRPAGLAAAVDRTFTEDFVWRGTIGGEIIVWNMIGPEYLGYQSLPTVPLAWAIQAVADFDQDGATDFVWRNTATNETYFWLMEGDSEVVRQGLALEPAVLDGNWQIAAAADMDRDGSTDLIWRNNSSGQNLVWFMACQISGGDCEALARWTTTRPQTWCGDATAAKWWFGSWAGKTARNCFGTQACRP
jgi:hypothetical protein